MDMIDHSLACPSRARLNRRLDALLYILRLQRGCVSLPRLRDIVRRMGLPPRRSRRAMLLAIYEEMKQ